MCIVEIWGKLRMYDSRRRGLPPSRHTPNSGLLRRSFAMGNRAVSTVIAAGMTMLWFAGAAAAQAVPQGWSPSKEVLPAKAGASVAPPVPVPPPVPAPVQAEGKPQAQSSGRSKARKRNANSETDSPSLTVPIVSRAPVRREVQPVPRRRTATGRSATTSAAAKSAPAASQPKNQAASSTPAVPVPAPAQPVVAPRLEAGPQPSTPAPSTSQPAPGSPPASRRQWPVVPGPAVAAAGAGGTVATAGAAAATEAAAPSPHAWSEAEIKQAQAHCATVLRGIDAALAPESPIKEGECGSPVVYRVTSVGKGPAVELVPPVTLTCDMVAAMDRWIKREVQPAARSHLGGSIVRIDTMSSYSCRNAYGRAKNRLSEHGKANAIDISGFATAKDVTTVLAGWGPTIREQKAIAAKLEAERIAQQNAARQQQGGSGSAGGGPAAPPVVPGIVVTPPVVVPGQWAPALGHNPNRLGGPKAQPSLPKAPVSEAVSKQRFLKEIHAAACKHFGTVLGPEANNAHKNHFHLDMAQRNRGNFCE